MTCYKQAAVRRWLQRRSGVNAAPSQDLHNGRHNRPADSPFQQAITPSSDRAAPAGYPGKHLVLPGVSPMDSWCGAHTLAALVIEQVCPSVEDKLLPPEIYAPCGSEDAQSGTKSAGQLYGSEPQQRDLIELLLNAVHVSNGLGAPAGGCEDFEQCGGHQLQDPSVPDFPSQQAPQPTLDIMQTVSYLQDPEITSGSIEKDALAQDQSRHEQLSGELNFHGLQLLLSSHETWGQQIAPDVSMLFM